MVSERGEESGCKRKEELFMIIPMSYRKGTVSLISLGCSKAQVDAEVGLGRLLARGYRYMPEPEGAEFVIINTCSFISPAIEEAIEEILSIIDLKERGKVGKVVVAGCLVDRYGDELKRELPEVDAFYPSHAFRRWLEGNRPSDFPRPRGPELPQAEDPRFLLSPKSYAYIKIAEGCDRRCAFCTIPRIRGPQRSRALEDILKEGEALAKRGIQEILLVSQDTVRWGRDLPGKPSLVDLLQAIEDAPSMPAWVRLHYLYPERFPSRFYQLLARGQRILPYVDIPIQHASDTILSRMRRGCKRFDLERIWEKFRSENPDLVLRTTVIVGHPGEGEKEFEELLRFLETFPFEWVGIFPYSPEEGTLSYLDPEQVPEEVCKRRVEIVEELTQELSRRLLERFVGREFPVLVDGRDPETGSWVGRTFASSPGVDGQVVLKNYSGPPGRFVTATIEELTWPDFTARAKGLPVLRAVAPSERSFSHEAI